MAVSLSFLIGFVDFVFYYSTFYRFFLFFTSIVFSYHLCGFIFIFFFSFPLIIIDDEETRMEKKN